MFHAMFHTKIRKGEKTMKNTNTTKLDIAMKKEQLEKELARLNIYEGLRQALMDKIKWDYMQYHEADEEHEESWFTAPDMDNWRYNEYLAAMDIVNALDSIIVK